jgi:hypothetical protein
MGGFGSGHRRPCKAVAEGRSTLDTGDLKRMKLLAPAGYRSGILRWSSKDDGPPPSVGYSLNLGADDGLLCLDYRMSATGESVAYGIRMVSTPCQLGGVRWWFICPLSKGGTGRGRRVRKLYLRGKYFGCRHCHALTYTSTRESDSRVYAALRAGMHLRGAGDLRGAAVSQLGFLLKVLTAGQKRLGRVERTCRLRMRE